MAGCIFASASGEQAERMKRKRKEGQDGAGCFEIFLITFLNLIWRCGNELVPLRPAFEGFDLGCIEWGLKAYEITQVIFDIKSSLTDG